MPCQLQNSGEFAGWHYWGEDSFEAMAGPFYFSRDEQGIKAAFRVEERHLNGQKSLHGGCMMVLGDFALFALADDALGEDHGVTMTYNNDFLGGARAGELVLVRGEVVRSGRSIIFVRGLAVIEVKDGDDRPCFSFSGTIKRIRARP